MNYVFGEFIFDVVSIFPWSVYRPSWIFLRYLKIKKLLTYQKFIDEFLTDIGQNFLNIEQQKKVINAFRLLFQILFVSHFMANMWVYIGMYIYDNQQTGWITVLNSKGGIQRNEFMPLYISSFYFVITTFSSVGYGDVTGNTKEEYIF
jgi:hypothetical protein